jgi:hypothetical protein
MDEAGLALKARQVGMAAYAKMDCIYLFPSFFPPIRAAQVVTVQPIFSFVQIGLPVIVYRWRVKIDPDDGEFRLGLASEVWSLLRLLLRVRSTISSTFLGTGSRITGQNSEYRTAYLAWKGKYRRLTPLGIQFRRSRKLSTPSRPFLLEAIAGSGFDIGGFIAFMIFLAVVGMYSACCMTVRMFSIIGIGMDPGR